ncbi:DMT family transporter [Bacillus sp. RG28]|uniref:DMT family transporter n=1 Tax=Gottfriedia endophytica TaxID=2820819 RepID=A0A940NWB8_9BACI|nr:DMT family transporter [Gottfriedia endophytica]MBP0726148.1 DMT family transporter [Gottfriedia endophytica]
MKNVDSKGKKATLGMVLAMAIFGSVGFLSAKTGVKAIELVFIRCTAAAILLGTLWVLSGTFKTEKWNKPEIIKVICCGLFLMLNWVSLFKSFEMMHITIAISIYYLAPVIVFIVGSIIYKEKVNLLSLFCILLCFSGTMLVSGVGTNGSFQEILSSGLIWAFLAACFYAMLMIIGKGIQKLSAYSVTMIQTSVGALLLLPFVNFSSFHHLQSSNWIALMIIGFVHTGFVYMLFFGSIRHLSTKTIAALTFLDPAVAIILDIIFNKFHPSLLQIIGIILSYTGIAVILFSKNSKQNKKETKSNTETLITKID